MSAVSIRHKSRARHYNVDAFISQLLASRKFDELAEKLAVKAAYMIKHMDSTRDPIQRTREVNIVINRTENTLLNTPTQSNKEKTQENEKEPLTDAKLSTELTGKIDPQAVMDEMTSVSENLKLKYDSLKKMALENKIRIKSELDKLTQSAVVARTSNINAAGKNQNDAEQQPLDETISLQHDTRDNDGQNIPKGNSELNDNNNIYDQPLVDREPVPEQIHYRAAQQAEVEVKGTTAQEGSQVDNRVRAKENSAIFYEDTQLKPTSVERKITEKVEKNGVEQERGMMKDVEYDNVVRHLRVHKKHVENNRVSSDYNPDVGVYKTMVQDDSGDRRSKERSPEDQGSKEESAIEPVYKDFKPPVRKEGGILYTYVQAPEYEEYHEEMAKWQKKHPQNPADFMK